MSVPGAWLLREFGFAHVKQCVNDDALSQLNSGYSQLYERSGQILLEAKRRSIGLDDYYRSTEPDVIAVPEASYPTKLCRFEYLCGASSLIKDFVTTFALALVSDLCEDDVVLFKDKCNIKGPGGGAFTPHQDHEAYRHFPPREYFTAMVPLDDMTPENGCVQFATNYKAVALEYPRLARWTSSRECLFESHVGGVNHGSIVASATKHLKWQPIFARAGDVVVFDGLVPHQSEVNRSTSARRAFFFTFNRTCDGDYYESYYDRKRKSYDDPAFHVATPTLHKTSSQ